MIRFIVHNFERQDYSVQGADSGSMLPKFMPWKKRSTSLLTIDDLPYVSVLLFTSLEDGDEI